MEGRGRRARRDLAGPRRPLRAGAGDRASAGPWGSCRPAGWRVRMHNEIPLSRGLGSSATATVGGLLAADAFAGGRLNERRMLTLAAELEGHPDNAAAALRRLRGRGQVEGRPERSASTPRGTCVRPCSSPTGRSRRRRCGRPSRRRSPSRRGPQRRPGRAGGGRPGDRAHGLLRARRRTGCTSRTAAEVYPELPALVAAARNAGALGACLSGAGSTVIAFADSGTAWPRSNGPPGGGRRGRPDRLGAHRHAAQRGRRAVEAK